MLTLIVALFISILVLSIWCLNLAYTIAKVEKSLRRVSSFICDMFLDRDKKLESLENALNGILKADSLHYQNVQEQIDHNKDLFQDLIIEQNSNFTKYIDEKIDNIKYYKLSVIERPKKKTRKTSKR